MNITLERKDHLNGSLKISLQKSDYEAKWNESLKTIRKRVDMKGFRKGMVPKGLVQKMYGTSALVEEVNKILSDTLYNYIVDERLNVLGDPLPSKDQPEINWEEAGDFDFHFDLGFGPEINFEFGEEGRMEYYQLAVSDAEIDERVHSYAANFGEVAPIDKVVPGSMLKADIQQLNEDGSPLENSHITKEASFLYEKISDDKLKDELSGKLKDDVLNFVIEEAFTNVSDLSSMLAIKKEEAENLKGLFQMTIRDISVWQETAVNQELFDKVYGQGVVSSEEEFRAKVKEEIQRDNEYNSEFKFVMDLKSKMLGLLKPELPVEFLKRWLEKTNEKLTAEEIENNWPAFENDLAWQIIKDKVAEKEEVTVNDEDMMEMAKEITLAQFRQYGFTSLPEEELTRFATSVLENKEQRKRIAESKRDEKIHKAMKNLLQLDVVEISREDFEAKLKATSADFQA